MRKPTATPALCFCRRAKKKKRHCFYARRSTSIRISKKRAPRLSRRRTPRETFVTSVACSSFASSPFSARASEVYFSPDGGIQNQIIKRVNLAKSTIDIAMYSFTAGPIAQALADAHARGVKIRLIRDISQSRGKNDENAFLRDNGIEIKEMGGKGRGIFHNKFAIFDDKLVETGSFNWTTNAEKYNHENAIFFTDPELIQAFKKEFNVLWEEPVRGSESVAGRETCSRMRWMERALPVVSSMSITQRPQTGGVAGGDREGFRCPVGKRLMAGSIPMPMTLSCGPQAPASVRKAVPPEESARLPSAREYENPLPR